MLYKSFLSSKLEDTMFLNVNSAAVNSIFKFESKNNLYLPLKSERLISGVKTNVSFDEIPVKDFVEGMYFVLGCDSEFEYSKTYKDILSNCDWCSSFIKGLIAVQVKSGNFCDAYLLLRGLYTIESNDEVYDKMLWCIYNEYVKKKELSEEMKSVTAYGKDMKYPSAFFYESLMYNDAGSYNEAWDDINLYFSYGGQRSTEIDEYISYLKPLSDLEKGKENMRSNPKYALEWLLPMLDETDEDAFLYYYIGVAYRHLGIYQKAIYYLNEAIRVDNTIVDLYNEMGLNFACLQDYDTAIKYFKKAFEATRSVEICSNIIMCCINKGDLKQANAHMELAKKIDENDSILKDIEILLRGNNKDNGD
ncbi:MAG: tetratricopeptide repeat protein [Bacillota bacterium]|nr:tetratricopeptide repeat protein [Bacillota bacterium]